jgi:Ca2+/Na+ antiporter
MKYLEFLAFPVDILLEFILPKKTYPTLAFFFLVIYFFFTSDLIISIINIVAEETGISTIWVSLTIVSWGAAIIEVVNLIVATNNNLYHVGMVSISSAIALTFILCLPLSSFLKISFGASNYTFLLQSDNSSVKLFLPAILITGTLVALLEYKNMKLSEREAKMLIAIYVTY